MNTAEIVDNSYRQRNATHISKSEAIDQAKIIIEISEFRDACS